MLQQSARNREELRSILTSTAQSFLHFCCPNFFFLKKSSQPMCAYDKCTLLPASKCSQSKQPGFLPLQAAEWMRKRSGIPGEVL